MFVRWLIMWLVRRTPYHRRYKVVTFLDDFEFRRFEPFWPDERVRPPGRHVYRPPWWRPAKNEAEPMHDHPRWTITIVLKGEVIERTPWEERRLRPGSIVIRSRKAIHSLQMAPGQSGKVWTLFIVGRRNHAQNTYQIEQRGRV